MSDDKKHPLDREGPEASKFVADYLATLVHMIRQQMTNTNDAMVTLRALILAVAEKQPDVVSRVEFYKRTDRIISDLETQSRQIIVELDRLHGRVKYDEKPT